MPGLAFLSSGDHLHTYLTLGGGVKGASTGCLGWDAMGILSKELLNTLGPAMAFQQCQNRVVRRLSYARVRLPSSPDTLVQ